MCEMLINIHTAYCDIIHNKMDPKKIMVNSLKALDKSNKMQHIGVNPTF